MFSFTRTKSEICQNVNIWSLLEESSWVFVLTILYNFLRLNFFQLQMHAKIRMNTDFGVKDLVALAPSSCAERLPVAYFLRLCFSFLCQKIVLIILNRGWMWDVRSRCMALKHEKHSVAGSYLEQECNSLTSSLGRIWAPRSLRNILQPITNNLKKEKVHSMTLQRKDLPWKDGLYHEYISQHVS